VCALAGVEVLELFLVSSGDCVVESSHSPSSSSSDDRSPSWNTPSFASLLFCFTVGASPIFLRAAWDAFRGNAVVEWFFRRFPNEVFLAKATWELLRFTSGVLGL
jgi:hypothetical protein